MSSGFRLSHSLCEVRLENEVIESDLSVDVEDKAHSF